MANVTAQMVKELRDKTGAGMMDCKAALGETSGDMESAVDWLRKKGLSKAAKKAGRVAAEGLIGVAIGGTQGRRRRGQFGDRFRRPQRAVPGPGAHDRRRRARRRHRRREDQGRPRSATSPSSDAINSAIATIGENMTLRRAAASVGQRPAWSAAMCTIRCREGLGKIGVIVGARVPRADRTNSPRSAARSPCTSRRPIPQAVEPAGLDPQVVAREKDILADKFRAQGKPEAMIAKIVEFGLKTFYKEVCLLEQPYIHDPDKTVAQALKEAEGKVGGAIKVTGFVRYALGEGIDRPDSDFAAEVAATAGRPAERRCGRRPAPTRVNGRADEERGMAVPTYRRVIVKLSGEALSGPEAFGIHQPTIDRFAADIVAARALGRHHRGRGRRRQRAARRRGRGAGRVAADRRRHGHAGDRDECAGARSRDRARRRLGPHHVGADHAAGVRDL